MCGKCIKTRTGFRLENTKRGLRWGPKGANVDGMSFDDNFIGRGTTQAKNLCILAKYGNKPPRFSEYPTSRCAGRTKWGIPVQRHWFGNCRTGSRWQEKCCANAKLMRPGQDWADFSNGNSCRGDRDKDGVLGTLECEFGSASNHAPWPIRACYPLSKTCRDLGVKDNLCGTCHKTPDGFKLKNTVAGLRYAGYSFDDNHIGRGSYQARNICILAKFGNKGVVSRQPLSSCTGVSNRGRGVSPQVHWYGNCRKGSWRQKNCCTNAFVVGSYFNWNKFSKGNSCRGDRDTDRTLGEIRCAFDDGSYRPGKWPRYWRTLNLLPFVSYLLACAPCTCIA